MEPKSDCPAADREAMEMETLKEMLDVAVAESVFDLELARIAGDGESGQPSRERVSAAQLREVYLRERNRSTRLNVSTRVPEAAMKRLVDSTRRALGEFIHSETDTIGHAFPVDGSHHDRSTFRSDGLCDQESWSRVGEFTRVLVRAAAIMGVKTATRLLVDWKGGEPVQLHMCTVLSGFPLDASVSPHPDLRIVPLPLTTAELPRLPMRRDVAPMDYLGRSLLTLRMSAGPALFRPDPDAREGSARSKSVERLSPDLACKALSLQANGFVSASFFWHEYPDAAPFGVASTSTWGPSGDDRLKPMNSRSSSRDLRTGEVTITPAEDAQPLGLDEGDLVPIIEALRLSDRKLRIAVDRWCRSRRPEARLEDRYIDLRVALEALYLQDFDGGRSQEMGFRLALFGAWYLAEDFEERRSIRKTLHDAYSMASRAVHGSEVLKKSRGDRHGEALAKLARAQDLCRRGILKLLREGPPRNWGDLVLGSLTC